MPTLNWIGKEAVVNPHHDNVVLSMNGVPCAQIEMKTLGINPQGVSNTRSSRSSSSET